MNVPQYSAAMACAGFCSRIRSPLRLLLGFSFLLLLVLDGCAKYSPPPTGTASGRQICDTARSNLGVRYKTGGTLPSTGFDCSGLIQWTFAQYGIPVPRTTREQAKTGLDVAKKNLRPGDLVVFKISGRNNLHTGIYTGNGKFIHSPGTGKRVREEALDSKYWKSRFLTARRMPQIKER
ncbi:MAG: C40 family peptidase [Deltaproteobacteria bacterium]|jgi:cell wall-associated NlpC family hydrolase|nr:C40 family peptidase [Deltaproteobacteria bacterium]